ncbi:MAG: 16S rRNA (uracil(1498)-N(3))-methyltransferase [Nannocystaceae bacterium]
MNLLLLEPADLLADNVARVSGRRLEHVRKVHRAQVGDTLKVGLVDGLLGEATITALDREKLEFTFTLTDPPPPPATLQLIVALPRPPTFHKVLQQATAMGVKRFAFVHAARVEGSYWTARALQGDGPRKHLLLGLEQARDTVLPVIEYHRKLHTFFETRYHPLTDGTQVLVGHPDGTVTCPPASPSPRTLVIGPEGGWIERETLRFVEEGATLVSLGPRILRVETAVVAMLARLSIA